MDFFSQQDQARSATRKLVLLFCCAVAVLIVMTSLLVYGVLFYAQGQPEVGLNTELLASDIFIKVSIAVIGIVLLGSLFRLAQLRGGGKVIAEAMQGRLLNTGTRDADERKVLNVVEEMAIAAGMPVPPVYLIEDPAINAFAAGYHQQDAVIGVTRGCIAQLDRDELQGVIAHEFSHVYHGDMRLNIKLIGILYGIMVLGMIGYYMMRSSMYTRRRNRGGGLVFLGLGLVVIGYGGTFFGNLIKAAVSRQREFLADASAVQFTRNPYGISGALKKIGGYSGGSKINSIDASEISHMLFEEGVATGFSSLFATHPPLKERIKRIDPHWQGDFADASRPAGNQAETPGMAGFSSSGADGGSAVDAIGKPGPGHMELAGQQMRRIPAILIEQAHTSLGASVLMYALVMDFDNPESLQRQQQILDEELDRAASGEFEKIYELMIDLDRTLYLPLLEIAIPSLKQLSDVQYRNFMSVLTKLMVSDQQISLLEWSLFKILRNNLAPQAGRSSKTLDIGKLRQESEVLLSALASAGHATATQRLQAFASAAEYLQEKAAISYQAVDAGDIRPLDEAVDKLRLLKPLQKPMLLKAMAACINADGRVTPVEAELLQAVGSLLDCPIPPLLDGQKFI